MNQQLKAALDHLERVLWGGSTDDDLSDDLGMHALCEAATAVLRAAGRKEPSRYTDD